MKPTFLATSTSFHPLFTQILVERIDIRPIRVRYRGFAWSRRWRRRWWRSGGEWNGRERWKIRSKGMGWYRCEAVVSSIAILSFSSGLRSHLFFRVLRSHIPSCRLLRCKPRRFPLHIWIRISEYSPLSATNFCGDDPVNTLFFHPFRSRNSSRAIDTRSSQSSLLKRFEVSRRSREVLAASGATSH